MPARRAWLAIALFCGLVGNVEVKADSNRGFSLTPMRLQEPRGLLQLTNGNRRAIQVTMRAYPSRMVNGSMTAALEPFPQEEQDSFVRVRPQAARISASSSRNFSYKVLDPARSFYLCATTPDGILLLRICARWQR